MAVVARTCEAHKEIRIKINGRFGPHNDRDFRDAYANTSSHGVRYIVDLENTEFMDHSALSMLLVLREHAGGAQADVRVENCRPQIRQVLESVNFQQVLTLA